MVAAGQRAVLVYAVLDIHRSIRLRRQYILDATYAELAEQAKHAGVEILPPLFFFRSLSLKSRYRRPILGTHTFLK